MKNVANRPDKLFLSPSNLSRAISKNAISFFLREVIKDSGAVQDPNSSVRAHSIRGVGSTFNFALNWSLDQIMKAATWASDKVFQLFYLKKVKYQYEKFSSLGPFVSAGEVINN